MGKKDWWTIGMDLHGRRKILIPKPDELNKDTLRTVIQKAIAIHSINETECDYLWNYYKGRQPILKREKKVRPDINNKVVVNHAKECVAFKMNYGFSESIQYIQQCTHNEVDIETEKGFKSKVHALNELMYREKKDSVDHKLQKYRHVCGTAYRMTLPRQEKNGVFKMGALTPMTAFVVYDTDIEETPWLCGKYFQTKVDGRDCKVLCCYTVDFKIDLHYFGKQDDSISIEPTTYEFLPIIEYPLNEERMGCFESALGIMDTINRLQSNTIDSIEQNVQHLIMYKNCDIDDKGHDNFIKKGVIKVKSNNARDSDVKVITVTLDLTDVQTTVNNLYQSMLQILSMPDRKSSSGGNTGTSVSMSEGWTDAENDAVSSLTVFKDPEIQFLHSVLRIAKDSSFADPLIKQLTINEIDISCPRNRTDNYLVKAQGMMMELQAGINPRYAVRNSGLYSDAEQVYADSPNLHKWAEKKVDETASQTSILKKDEDVLIKPPVTV